MYSWPQLVSTLCPKAWELRLQSSLHGVSLNCQEFPREEMALLRWWRCCERLVKVTHSGKSHFAGYKWHSFSQHNYLVETCHLFWYIAVPHQDTSALQFILLSLLSLNFSCGIPCFSFLHKPLLVQHLLTLWISQKLPALTGSLAVSVPVFIKMLRMMFKGGFELWCFLKWNKFDLSATLPFPNCL